MKKTIKTFILILSALALTHCGSNDANNASSLGNIPINEQEASDIQKINYQYSWDNDIEIEWSVQGDTSDLYHCVDQWFAKISKILGNSIIQQGPLSPNLSHTADNPFHQLTVTYKNGLEKVFNLHVSTAYENELVLSNTQEVIQFFNYYLDNYDSCPE